MLRLATDADVHGDLIRGLQRRRPQIDVVRVQDVMGDGVPDLDVLAWAAGENRILITNDRNTMVGHAYERARRDKTVCGLIVTTNLQSLGSAIEDILFLADNLSAAEMREQLVIYLPFA